MLFRDRLDAGRRLAARLEHLRGADAVVLGLPRGGVVVGAEIAAGLGVPLDVLVARKLGAPMNPEFAIGALAPGAMVLNADAIAELGIGQDYVDGVAARERLELERRERLYRGDRPPEPVEGRVAILVDDGLATGATAAAAAASLRLRRPSRLILAFPVAAPGRAERIRGPDDEVVCLFTPSAFYAVGQFYADFRATTDDEVLECLERCRAAQARTGRA